MRPSRPDGIGLYSKNSAVSHLPSESGGIRTALTETNMSGWKCTTDAQFVFL